MPRLPVRFRCPNPMGAPQSVQLLLVLGLGIAIRWALFHYGFTSALNASYEVTTPVSSFERRTPSSCLYNLLFPPHDQLQLPSIQPSLTRSTLPHPCLRQSKKVLGYQNTVMEPTLVAPITTSPFFWLYWNIPTLLAFPQRLFCALEPSASTLFARSFYFSSLLLTKALSVTNGP